MTHIGYPWIGTVLRNLLRWENCYLATNAYAPKYWPQELVDHIRTRGQDKVMYATEFPVIGWERSLREIGDHDFSDSVRSKLLGENARQLLKV
jgi:predicted TIM-barrel fold metal-dependent hydrolase